MDGGSDFSLTRSLQNSVDKLIGYIPELLGVLLLLLVGWILARVAKRLVISLLRRVRFERSITLSPAGNYVTRIIEHPTSFVGNVVYWIVLLAFISFAISALGVPALTEIIQGIYSYIPNIIAAIIIFLVASAITVGAEAFVVRVLSPGALSKMLAAVVPAVIMPIAIFMILNQLQIAEDIVNITYTALVGAVALGLALAFGLGGRDVAAQILGNAYAKAQENKDQIKAEMEDARRKTRGAAQRTRRSAES